MAQHADKPRQAIIYGLNGPRLTQEERAFFKQCNPWGFILFARNIDSAAQVADLTADLRALVDRSPTSPHVPILIDQEGGRVARLTPPLVRAYPPAALYGALYDNDPERACQAATLGGYLIGCDLHALGITVNCMPCLDVAGAGMHEIIGDRAYGASPDKVAQLGRAAAKGLMQAGILPVMKHIPGHGRGQLDSHLALPKVTTKRAELEQTDFEAFRQCAYLPLAMTAHICFEALDKQAVATHSKHIIQTIIRESIGFTGLLISDDISMQALTGTLAERAQKALNAGCDVVLHCTGDMAEMQELAAVVPQLQGQSLARAAKIDELLAKCRPQKVANAENQWQKYLSGIFP